MVLWRRRMTIFAALAVGLGLAGAVLFFIKPHYTARAIILVNTNARNILPREINPSAAARYDTSLILNEVEIMRSRVMASGVITRLGLEADAEFRGKGADETASAFLSRLAARPVPDARLLATLSDCVLYAVKWDKTPREAVAGGIKHFTDFGYGALAMVLTNVDVRRHAAYGYGDSAAYYGTYANYAKKAA